MKLHLPISLRHGLIKTLASVRNVALPTLCSGALLLGLCAFTPLQAADSTPVLFQVDDSEDEDDLLSLILDDDPGIVPFADVSATPDAPITVANGATYEDNINISGGINDGKATLLLGTESFVTGSITLNSGTHFNRSGGASGNGYIQGNVNANGNKIMIWGNGIIFEDGEISNLGFVEVAGPGNTATIRQNLSPANMADNSTTFTFDPQRGNAGNLKLEGSMTGFSVLAAHGYGSGAGANVYVDGNWNGTGSLRIQDTTNTSQLASVYFRGVMSNVDTITIDRGKVYFSNDGDIVGEGTLTIEGAGSLFLQSNISHSGELVINGGTVYWSKPDGSGNDKDTNTLSFSQITINSGATFWINHANTDQSDTAIELAGGTFKVNDMSPDNAVYNEWKELNVSDDSRLTSNWNGGAAFGILTGSADLTISKTTTEAFILLAHKVNNYNGSILGTDEDNAQDSDEVKHNKRRAVTVQFDSVSQEEDYTLTVGDETNNMDVKLGAAFTMGGAGDLSIVGSVTQVAAGSFSKSGTGTLSVSGNTTLTGGLTLLKGDIELGGSLTTGNGAVELYSNLTVGNGGTLNGQLTIYEDGQLNITAGNMTVNGFLTNEGGLTAGANLTVNDTFQVYAPSSTTITGELSVNGELGVYGGTLQAGANATVDAYYQEAGQVTVAGGLSSTGGFNMRDGSLNITGKLHIGGSVYMYHDGTLSFDSVQLEDDSTLFYTQTNGSEMIDFTDLEFDGSRLWLNLLDYSVEEMSQGVDLGLMYSETDGILADMIYVLAYARDDYKLYEGENGHWYIRAENGPTVDPNGSGIWDENWQGKGGMELETRPLGAVIDKWEGQGTAYISDRAADFIQPTATGTALVAQFDSDSLPEGADIVGGRKNETAEEVHNDIWIDVIGGNYRVIAGGNENDWQGSKSDFFGNTHIQLRSVNGQEVSAIAVVGGSNQGGAQSHFTGDSFISIQQGVNVRGAVIGGSMFAHGHTSHFYGNSEIYIYTALAADNTAHISGGDQENLQIVVGGNYIRWNTPGTHTFSGDSSIHLMFADAYKNAPANFEKLIVGGDMIGYGGSSNIGGTLTHSGDTSIYITGAEGVTFTQRVIAGSYDASGSTIVHGGNTLLFIDSGNFGSIVIGGSVRGVLDDNASDRNPEASTASIAGGTQVLISGGTFRGFDTVATTADNVTRYSIGQVAVVGGNHAANPGRTGNNTAGTSSIGESTSVLISGGTFYGHVVGASAAEDAKGRIGSVTVGGSSSVEMLGGSMVKGDAQDNDPENWVPRVVGGFLLNMPTSTANADTSLSVGGSRVTIGGDAQVYDVIGGSWTSLLDVDNADLATGGVAQGEISVTLGDAAVVRGDVYAAGIQGGETSLLADSTHVDISSGVTFEKWDGSATIISGGYLNTRRAESEDTSGLWTEEQDIFGQDFYDNVSSVDGERTLTFSSSADYGKNLEKAWLVNFDTVELSQGALVTPGALLNPDGAEITVTGSGTLCLNAHLITTPDGNSRLNNSALTLTDGATLHLLRFTPTPQTGYLQGVRADNSTSIIIDLDQTGGANDTLLVADSISMTGGELTLNVNVNTSMLTDALIRSGVPEGTPTGRAQAPSVSLDNTQLNLHIGTLDNQLINGKDMVIHLVENMDTNSTYNLSLSTLLSLEKWFTGPVEVKLQDDGYLDLVGRTVSASTANFHTSRAYTVNGLAGARMLDNLYVTVNPELNSPEGDRAALLRSMEGMFLDGKLREADATMAAAGGASLPTLGQAFVDDVERQLRNIRNRSALIDTREAADADDIPVNLWVNAEAYYHETDADNTYSGYRLNSWGGTLGATADLSKYDRVGLAITAMYGDLRSEGPDSLKGDLTTSYLTAFWRHSSNAWSHTLVATAGIATTDVHRTVNYDGGSYTTNASPSGFGMGVMYEIGYAFKLDEDATTCIQPVVNVMWAYSHLNGFHETGSDAGLMVGAMHNNSVVIGAGWRAQSIVGEATWNRPLTVEGRVLAKVYTGDRRTQAETAFMGTTHWEKLRTSKPGAMGVELGASIVIPVSTSENIFLDASAELRNGETGFNVTAGYKWGF